MSLELIYPGRDTAALVKTLDDDWLISGPIRAAIHLSNAWHLLEPEAFVKDSPTTYTLNKVNVFGPNNIGHPWSQWATQSDANYSWLYFYACDLVDAYKERFNAPSHGMAKMLSMLENMPESLPEGEWTPPPGKPDEVYKS